MILNDGADIILLQVPLAKPICLSATGFIIWKQEGLRATGRSLRMTLYKDIAKHIDGWLRMGLLPPLREFCRHILSCRELKAESFKRCLHSVLRGVSL